MASEDEVNKFHSYVLAAIEYERRNGYAWYGYWPADLLKKDYPAWKARLDKGAELHNSGHAAAP